MTLGNSPPSTEFLSRRMGVTVLTSYGHGEDRTRQAQNERWTQCPFCSSASRLHLWSCPECGPVCPPPSGILPRPAQLPASLWATSSWVPTAGFSPAQPPPSPIKSYCPDGTQTLYAHTRGPPAVRRALHAPSSTPVPQRGTDTGAHNGALLGTGAALLPMLQMKYWGPRGVSHS